MTIDDLDQFMQAYYTCALWASTDNSDNSGGAPLDDNYDISDIGEDSKTKAREQCRQFIEDNAADLADLDAEQCGHDFWLTRNRHGAGFLG